MVNVLIQPGKYYKIRTVADVLSVSRKRVYQLRDAGLLRAVSLSPRAMRIDGESVLNYLQTHTLLQSESAEEFWKNRQQ